MALLLLFFQLVRVGLSGELFLLQQGVLHRVNPGDLRAVKARKVSGTKAVLRHSATREKTITVLRSCIGCRRQSLGASQTAQQAKF